MEHHGDLEVELVVIKTEGDRDQRSCLTQIGGQGVFTKAIEDALVAGTIDIAVHSLKDLPSTMEESLALGAVPEREDVRDVLVTIDGRSLEQLPRGALIASGSLRRRSQLLAMRPDLQLTTLRGNIDTRLAKLKTEGLDGLIMAKAALNRLGRQEVPGALLEVSHFVPAVGQGAIGVQIRKDDASVRSFVASIDHPSTHACVTAERSFLRTLDSGCQFPVGAHGFMEKDLLMLRGYVASPEGTSFLIETQHGAPHQAEAIGVALGERLLALGARTLLDVRES
jgi:hydroxymethylbilane synthase